MQRRAFERIPVSVNVRFCCSNYDYSGTVSNLSEKGMYICTSNVCFPFDSEFNIIFPIGDEPFNIPVKVSRITRNKDRYDGIGIELLDLPQRYLQYIESLRDNA